MEKFVISYKKFKNLLASFGYITPFIATHSTQIGREIQFNSFGSAFMNISWV